MLTRLVDREMEFCGKPVISMLVGAIPIILLDPLFDGSPSAAPAEYLYPALGLTGVCEAVVVWLYVKFEIKKWRELRALGAAEEEAAKRNG